MKSMCGFKWQFYYAKGDTEEWAHQGKCYVYISLELNITGVFILFLYSKLLTA